MKTKIGQTIGVGKNRSSWVAKGKKKKEGENKKLHNEKKERRKKKRETNYNVLAGRKNEHSSSKSPAENQPAGNLLFYSSSSTEACNKNASAAHTNPAAWCPTTGTRPPSNAAANPRLNALARCGPCQRTEEQPRRTGTGWRVAGQLPDADMLVCSG